MKMKRIALSLGVLVALSFAYLPVHAGDQELLDVLLKNGVITKQQYKELNNKDDNKGVADVSTKGGIKIKSADKDFTFQFGGRLMVDAAYVDEDITAQNSGFEMRRLRLFAKGSLYQDWGYKIQMDYAENSLSVKDAYLKYKPLGLTVGQFKQAFSLEELTSSKYITFMERSLPNSFATGRRIGIGYSKGSSNHSFSASIYGDESGGSEDGDEGYGIGARATFAPIALNKYTVHIGVSLAQEDPVDDSNDVRFRARPEVHVTNTRLVDTGSISNVDKINKYGVELAGVWGPLSVQAEHISTNVERESGFSDYDLTGSYIFTSYFLTGESRPYMVKDGEFGRVKPNAKIGAWEVALRYSTLDLNDGALQGGKEDNLTLGLNWYLNPHVRIMANYINVKSEKGAVNDDLNIYAMRTQIDF